MNGAVSGPTAVEIKTGTMKLELGTDAIVSAIGEENHKENNNGPSTSGYGIAVVENGSYKGNPSFTMNAGTVNGGIVIVRDNDTIKRIGTVTINGGTVNGIVGVRSDAVGTPEGTITVTGGTFDSATVLAYLSATGKSGITLKGTDMSVSSDVTVPSTATVTVDSSTVLTVT